MLLISFAFPGFAECIHSNQIKPCLVRSLVIVVYVIDVLRDGRVFVEPLVIMARLALSTSSVKYWCGSSQLLILQSPYLAGREELGDCCS